MFLFSQLLYVDSLDISALELTLPEARFAVNRWSKEDIDAVLFADLKSDGISYGKLEVILFHVLSFLRDNSYDV